MPKRAHEKLTTGATVLSSFAYVKYGLMGSKTKAARARSVSFFIYFFSPKDWILSKSTFFN